MAWGAPAWVGLSDDKYSELIRKKAWAQIKDDIDESGIDRQELVVVNSNVDSRGWTGDEAEEP